MIRKTVERILNLFLREVYLSKSTVYQVVNLMLLCTNAQQSKFIMLKFA